MMDFAFKNDKIELTSEEPCIGTASSGHRIPSSEKVVCTYELRLH